MNDRKVCFISCVNDRNQYEICRSHIEALQILDGFNTELMCIEDASSMCAGYNTAMRLSDAKYKIYLHQDVWLLEPTLLTSVITEFVQHPEVGMIGLAGAEKMPLTGKWWEHPTRFGRIFHNNSFDFSGWYQENLSGEPSASAGLDQVEVIDGILMATQFDLPWRDDIFQGWHFYDASHSAEFRRAGHQVAVLRQNGWWYQHNCGPTALDESWDHNRDIYFKEYVS